ncbi:MAG: ornithine carbamoyltransferase [Dethiobacter sp.]|jgi:ornithine carbamoyltransferase|nr:ornithine carbamoyltransferase [Dethiobacter sp.]MBS3900908.1 ornithine carbamoyltransferase [Dethiobacter sp.]MBS3988994.1 ornithine carbamoyltransferase [Dethiobacter sp.]
MVRNLRGRDFLTVHDFSKEELSEILLFALQLKQEKKAGLEHQLLRGKTLGMIFQKASTRTRVSFEVGMYQLGGCALFLSAADLQIGRGEPVKDTARVLSRYLDGIMIRTFDHSEVEELATFADIPVINGLTDLLHPCQAMADLMTILEQKGKLAGLKLAYLGDGNNVAHSLLLACSKMGLNIAVASPKGYEVKAEIVAKAKESAAVSGTGITLTTDPREAAAGADILYTDVWASMGQETEHQLRLKAFQQYQLNKEMLKMAADDAIVLHCLPAHRGEEITDEVIEGPQSLVFDQAENRLHVQKAIMAKLI